MQDDDVDYGDRDDDRIEFADPGGRSALRAATTGKCPKCKKKTGELADFCRHCGNELNPRKFPCPNCRAPRRLTRLDKLAGYQCDTCADRAEGRVMSDY